jgi:hypothetical protein
MTDVMQAYPGYWVCVVFRKSTLNPLQRSGLHAKVRYFDLKRLKSSARAPAVAMT